MAQVPKFKLNTGAEIPAVGSGSWNGVTKEEQDKAQTWLLTAIQAGNRHIDTALGYGTEPAVGRAIKESGLPRQDIWVTTKLPWDHHGREEESINISLTNLDTDYVDIWLMHWPQALEVDEEGRPFKVNGVYKTRPNDFRETWAAMEKIYLAGGKAKAIGVSNFSIKNLEILLKTAKVVPAVNQVEMHPYLSQPELLAYCKEKGIVVTAYTPTGYATVREDATIGEIAAKYGVTPTQIILAWHVARGVAAVPAARNPEHQKENLNLPTLSEADFERVSALNKGQRLCNKPDEHNTVWGWTMEQLGW